MFEGAFISAIIPALNEEPVIGRVIQSLPHWVDEVIVVDNGSTDGTGRVASESGARVVHEPRKGYGTACLAGMAEMSSPDVVVFLDGDGSDDPQQMERLVAPVVRGVSDLVIGSRTLGNQQRGAITIQQRIGNALFCILLRCLWGVRYTDLGPFRAIRSNALHRLGMDDLNYGWTIQMQIRAAKLGLRATEVPVDYRRRVGRSKISGTIRGTIGAGSKIMWTILREWWWRYRSKARGSGSERLIVFARYPEPGQTKTRLIPLLGPQGAASLQQEMTHRLLDRADVIRRRRPIDVDVRYTGGDEQLMQTTFGASWRYGPQGEGSLGARMDRAIREAKSEGFEAVVVVGTDCPGVDESVLAVAFDALQDHDVVLGPATDGGYYLIGLRTPSSRLFEGIAWGTEHVLAQTMKRIRRAKLSCHLLAQLSDVDRPEDVPLWTRTVARDDNRTTPCLSVIVPTLNEQESIAATLNSVCGDNDVEVIVVDGGSSDRTVEFARRQGAMVVSSPRGRAKQMNAGAALATGDVLLFLHADTQLPSGYLDMIQEMLNTSSNVAGAFPLCIAAPGWSFRVIESLVNVRSRRLRMPYGDQAIFVTKQAFHQVGGFPDVPILEDFVLVRRLRRLGRIAIAPEPVATSARRWLTKGVVRTTLVNQACLIAFRLGVSPDRIARWRPAQKHASPAHYEEQSPAHQPATSSNVS